MSDTIEMSVWVKRGLMMVRRDELPSNDPDHPYNWIKAQGLRPEDYGYVQPQSDNCPHCGHSL